MTPRLTLLVPALALACAAAFAAPAPDPAEKAFVDKVSQGGMFEVAASKLAVKKASTADVRDFAVAEVHDHKIVGDNLAKASQAAGLTFAHKLDADWSAKVDALDKLSGADFDAAYMAEMATVHDADGAAFATEGQTSANAHMKAFANETHAIVLRHIGAIHAAPPPAK